MDFNNKANRDSLDLEEFTFDDPSSQSQTGKIDFFNIFFCFFNKRFFIGLSVGFWYFFYSFNQKFQRFILKTCIMIYMKILCEIICENTLNI